MNDSIINQLEAALGETVQLLSSLNQEEINKIPFEGSWTAAQVGQHLLLSENGMDGLLLTPTEKVDRKPDEKAGQLKDMFLDFSTKMKSPKFIVPEDKAYNKQELIQSLQDVKDKMLKAAAQADLAELAPLPDGHPLAGHTKLEIVHFITYHTTRHNRQIKNITGFIKK
jgi:hypothetical protein